VSDRHDDDQQNVVFDGVNDPIVADPNPKTRAAL
jgi:hypothetical protein